MLDFCSLQFSPALRAATGFFVWPTSQKQHHAQGCWGRSCEIIGINQSIRSTWWPRDLDGRWRHEAGFFLIELIVEKRLGSA